MLQIPSQRQTDRDWIVTVSTYVTLL